MIAFRGSGLSHSSSNMAAMRRPGFEFVVVVGLLIGYGAYWNSSHPPAPPAIGSIAAVQLDSALMADAANVSPQARWQREFQAARQILENGDAGEAKAPLGRALELAPQAGPEALHQTLAALGRVDQSQGAYGAAADFYLRAIEAMPSTSGALGYATLAYYQTRYAKASYSAGQSSAARQALTAARVLYEKAYPAGSLEHEQATALLRQTYLDIGDKEGAARLIAEQ